MRRIPYALVLVRMLVRPSTPLSSVPVPAENLFLSAVTIPRSRDHFLLYPPIDGFVDT